MGPEGRGTGFTLPDPRAVALTATIALALLVAGSLRVVPVGERLVVLRLGRNPRLRGPGLVAVLPAIERGIRVPLAAHWYDVTWLDATTRDGVRVSVTAAATGVVTDPVQRALSGACGPVVVGALESELRRRVACRDLLTLAEGFPGLAEALSARTTQWGIEITDVEISRIEARVDPGLVRWAGAR